MFVGHVGTSSQGASSSRAKMMAQYPTLSRFSQPSSRRLGDVEPKELSRINHALRSAAAKGNLTEVVHLCRRINEEELTPNAATYEAILKALARDGLLEEAWAVWADMEEMGIGPTPSAYNHLLEVRTLLRLHYFVFSSCSRRLKTFRRAYIPSWS